MKKILYAIAIIALAAGCTMSQVDKLVLSGKNVIKATTDAETRMAIKDAGEGVYSHVWEKGDAFVIYDAATPLKYEIVGEGGDTKADFAGEPLSGESQLYPVFYPYAENIDIYAVDGLNLFEYTFPSEVDDAVENYAQNVMIGLCDGTSVQMKNCAAYLKLSFSTNIVSYIDSILIEAIGGEPLCGKFRFGIDGATGEPIMIPDEGLTAENAKMSVKFAVAEMLTTNTRSFYIALPPVELSQGLKFTFCGQFSKQPQLEFTSSTATLERNVVLDMEEIKTIYDIAVELAPEAKVGETEYQTIEEAFNAASASDDDCTITLLRNVNVYSSISLANEGKKTVFDLNGYTVKGDTYPVISTTSDLTIEDGSADKAGQIIADGTAACAVRANKAKLTINGGTITGTGYTSGGCGVVYSYGDGSFLTVNGGKIVGTADNGRAINVTVGGKMTGGTVEGAGYAFRVYNEAQFTIDGENAVIYLNNDSNSPLTAASTSSRINMYDGYVFSAGASGCINSNTKVAVYGGHFNKEITAAAGYGCIASSVTGPDDREYSYGIKELDPVVELNGTSYSSIVIAVAAANATDGECALKLIADASATDTVIIRNASAKKTVLDLNGKTLSAPVKLFTDLEITDSATGGKITAKNSTVSIGSVDEPSKATLTLNGGTLEATSSYAVWAEGVSGTKPTVLVKKGTLSAPAGAAARSKYATYVFGDSTEGDIVVDSKTGFWTSTSSMITINKGQFTGETRIVYFGSGTDNVEINGGTISSDAVLWVYYNSTTNPTINVYGGKFSWTGDFAQAANTNAQLSGGFFTADVSAFAASGFKCATSTEPGYGWQIVEDLGAPDVAMVNTTGYKIFDEALEAALSTEGAVLKLLDDIALTADVKVKSALTIDLNGKTLTTANSKKLFISDAKADVKITDSSDEGTGKYNFTSTGGYVGLDIESGKLTLEKGTVVSKARGAAIRVCEGAEFHMTGGKLFNVATSTESYSPYALSVRGGKATIDAGVISCDLHHAIYLFTSAATLNINGGAFVAKTAGKYPIYTTSSGVAHVTTITNSVSEPLFVGCGSGDNEGRIFYNGYTISKIYTKAGYFTGESLGKPTSPDTYLASGYERKTGLSVKQTIEGTEYTFIMQVVVSK